MLKKSEWIILAEIRCESAMQHHSKTDIFAFFFQSTSEEQSYSYSGRNNNAVLFKSGEMESLG